MQKRLNLPANLARTPLVLTHCHSRDWRDSDRYRSPSHDNLAITALAAGKHVYIEKPLSLSIAGAEAIADAATTAGRQVMVGHLIRYHPHSSSYNGKWRLALWAGCATFRPTGWRWAVFAPRSVLDLCPHDLSLILALAGSQPTVITCAGASHMTSSIVDFLSCSLGFANNLSAGLQTSWLCPYKEHRLTVTGTAGALVFDDTKPWPEKLTLFPDQMRLDGEHFIIDRGSPINLPVDEAEPLKDEMRAFVHCCESGSPALTHIGEALGVQST